MQHFLSHAIRTHRRLFLLSSMTVLLLKCLSVAPAFLLGHLLDSLGHSVPASTRSVGVALGVLLMLTLAQSVINPIQTWQLVKCVQWTLRDHCATWTRQLFAKDYDVFTSLRLGALIKSFERGIDAHEKLLTFVITAGLPLLVEIVVIAVALIYLGGIAVFLPLLAAAGLYLWGHAQLVRWRRGHIETVNDAEERVASRLLEALQAGKSIKLEQAQHHALTPLINSFDSYAQAAVRVAASGASLGSAKILFSGLVTCGLLGWGAWAIFQPDAVLTPGALVALLSIAGNFCLNVSTLADAHRTLDQFMQDKKAFEHVLALPDLPRPGAEKHMSVERVTLQAPCSPALHVHPHQHIAIIGPSGAGKSRLLEALAGSNPTERSRLWINEHPLNAADLWIYQAQVRYCPQSCSFIEGTLPDSVLYGVPASPQLAASIAALGLEHLAARTLSANASNLSGGEARRLTLLRLLNRPGTFNLFDEPTAALDRATAACTWGVLFEAFKGRGLVCVTHDLDVLPRFDCVWVMADGEVIAQGQWSELRDDGRVQGVVRQMRQRFGH